MCIIYLNLDTKEAYIYKKIHFDMYLHFIYTSNTIFLIYSSMILYFFFRNKSL